MIFDERPRNCSGCKHWESTTTWVQPHGYLEAQCRQPKDDRDHKLKRASDYCSKWNVGDAA
jgi:hypothetical protein